MRMTAVAAAVILAAAGVVLAAADFRECVEKAGASVLGSSEPGFDEKVSRALYPSPVPKWYVDVDAAAQVVDVLACARDDGLPVCPRCGGHSFVGGSSCEGMVLDVHGIKGVKIQDGGKEAVVGAGNTLSEMLYGVLQGTKSERFVGVGTCPSVGVAGFVLGGGHSPYSGRLGLMCESVREFEFVTPAGAIVKASRDVNMELFWSSCGGGGAHFGVLTQLTIATHDATAFDRNVFFRYEWGINEAGEVLSKWLDYDQDDGDSWVRIEINGHLAAGIFGYGVCWDVASIAACEDRLGKADFFNVRGRVTTVLEKGAGVTDFQKFIGPAGGWAWERSTKSDEDAFTGVAWDEGGEGLNRLYTSAYLKLDAKPTVETLQKIAEICSDVDTSMVDWTLCQWNPWGGKQRDGGGEYAFAHREFDVFTVLAGAGKDNSGDGIIELKRMDKEIRRLTGDHIGGIYVNYPEFGISSEDYQYLYWGQSLPRLAALRAKMDPDGMLSQLQPLPVGAPPCPGTMAVSRDAKTFELGIDAYESGQRPGMWLYFSIPKDCSAMAVSGGTLSKAEADGDSDATVFAAVFSSSAPIVVEVDGGEDCEPELVAINGLMCVEGVKLAANTILGSVETSSPEESSEEGSGPSDRQGGVPIPIVAGALGGVVALAAAAFLTIFVTKRRRMKSSPSGNGLKGVGQNDDEESDTEVGADKVNDDSDEDITVAIPPRMTVPIPPRSPSQTRVDIMELDVTRPEPEQAAIDTQVIDSRLHEASIANKPEP